MKPLLTISCLLLLAGGAAAQFQTVAVHAANDCNFANGDVVYLTAGTHYLTLSGAESHWNADWENGGLTWLTHVSARVEATGDVFHFNPGTGWQPTPAAAAAEVDGTVFELTLAAAGDVTFAILDSGGCGDNRGTVYVTVDDPVGNESLSWGTLKARHR